MARGTKIAVLICLWCVPLFILYRALLVNWTMTWETVRVLSFNPPFLDLRGITSGLKTVQDGGDPLVANPYDPRARAMNYPRIWLHLFCWLGINDSNLWKVGVAFCVIYLIGISWLVLQTRGDWDSIVILIAGLSAAVFFAIERGNSDLLVFSLILLGCATSNRYARPVAFFVAAALKIFPLVALPVDLLLRPVRKSVATISATLLGFLLFAWEWHDIRAIQRNTPHSSILSFGMLSLKNQARHLNTWQIAILSVVPLLILVIAWVRRPRLEESALQSKFGELFLIFGGIYLFTFAVGSNWNYRLIFLIPTLPFVLEQARSAKHAKWAIIYVCLVILAENSFVPGAYRGIPLEDLTTFALFAMLLAIFLPLAKERLLGAGSIFHSSETAEASRN